MLWAILSDVHGNLEAFEAVLADLRRYPVTRVICLGDLMLWGPDNVACGDLARRSCDVTLLGDCDSNLLSEPVGFSQQYSPSFLAEFTRLHRDRSPEMDGRLAYLARLPRSWQEGDTLCVHGSPRNPMFEFVFPEDVYADRKMAAIFRPGWRVCFAGHTHVPGMFGPDGSAFDGRNPGAAPPEGRPRWWYLTPEECGGTFEPRGRVLVNVGSVGQPRDGDPRASYALFDGRVVTFRRVPYDFRPRPKLLDRGDPGDEISAQRLAEGR